MPPAYTHPRAWLAIGWGLVALVTFLSLTPDGPDTGIQFGDKYGHILAYFSLTAWFGQLYPGRPAILVIAFLAMGGGLELAQGLTDYREASLLDMLANALGVALGWLTTRLAPHTLLRLDRGLP